MVGSSLVESDEKDAACAKAPPANIKEKTTTDSAMVDFRNSDLNMVLTPYSQKKLSVYNLFIF